MLGDENGTAGDAMHRGEDSAEVPLGTGPVSEGNHGDWTVRHGVDTC